MHRSLSLLCALAAAPAVHGCTPATPTAAPPPRAVASTAAQGPAPNAASKAAPQRPPVLVVPVPEKVAQGQGRFKADWSFDIADHAGWSVHVHVIPPTQLVPAHHHLANDELVFVAGGSARWLNWTASGRQELRLDAGDAVLAPAGTVHGVHNDGEETLAAVVIQEPRFGQNWYVFPETVQAERGAAEFTSEDVVVFGPERRSRARWRDSVPSERVDAHRVYAAVQGATLRFEDKAVPLALGTIAVLPPGLQHSVEGGRLLQVEISDRPPEAP